MHQLSNEGVTAAIHDSKIVTRRIVADPVALHLEFDGADLQMNLSIADSEVARIGVRVANAADIVREGNRVVGQKKKSKGR